MTVQARPLSVLVIDDSAVVREGMTRLLMRAGGFEVATASDPVIATGKMQRQRPDVIVLDLEMPRMDGLTFLRTVIARDPIPVVICSGLAQSGTEAALSALDEGAVAVIAKPRLGVSGFLDAETDRLVDAVRAAATSRLRRYRGPAPAAARPEVPLSSERIVVVGASTGGTAALRELLEVLPPDAPGMVIVQHMPAGFTAAFARRLDATCRIEVKEAVDGDRLRAGRALIAPGNFHTAIERSGGHYIVRVTDGALVSRHRPSVNVLFLSAARMAGRNAIGVIMTGMGADGADGLLAMRRAGAYTIAQDEATCVVYGMPREAVLRDAVDTIVPLDAIASVVLRLSAAALPVSARAGDRT